MFPPTASATAYTFAVGTSRSTVLQAFKPPALTEGSGILLEPISKPLLSFVNSFLFKQTSNNQAFSTLLSSAPISLVTAPSAL